MIQLMNEIESRKDIEGLVTTFYSKIRKDELLGPIFNHHIKADQWPAHLEKLTDFWEANLFGTARFTGNPSEKHFNVDRTQNYSIEQKHFGKWLQLWFETINEQFEGANATKAKEAARRMAHIQFMMIWHQRPKNRNMAK